nr:DUF5685 family protein [Marinitoga lauensis]
MYGKLFDKLHDSHIENMRILIKNLRRKIVNYYGENFIIEYEKILREQFELEKEKLELENYFKPSIKIIQMIIKKHGLSLPEEFSYYVGTLTYMLDALYDFEKDIKRKNFNPIYRIYNIKKLNMLSVQDKEYIDFIIDYSIKNIIDILKNASISNKHFVKKLFIFSAIHHKAKIEELFSSSKRTRKKMKLDDSLYLDIKKTIAP